MKCIKNIRLNVSKIMIWINPHVHNIKKIIHLTQIFDMEFINIYAKKLC